MKKPVMHSIWLVLVLSVLSSNVRAGTLSDLTYEIADGQVAITRCNFEAEGELAIPAEIEGLPITSIGDRAFDECWALEAIVVPAAFHTRAEAAMMGGCITRDLWFHGGYTTHSNNTQPPTTPTIQNP